MKASTDLERVGDEAGRIAKMAINLADLGYPTGEFSDFRHIANLTHQIIASGLDAFARLDTDGAMRVIAADQAIDDAYDELVRRRSAEMREHPESIQGDMCIIWAARALERIGDHAKNIGEYVVYLVRGQDLRGGGKHQPS
jgi:phosphate transport system protein